MMFTIVSGKFSGAGDDRNDEERDFKTLLM
jgi:hypothetical protein